MRKRLFRNASIFTPVDRGRPAAGLEQGKLLHIEKGALLSENGLITDIGEESRILENISRGEHIEEIDCQGRCMVPGFVDPHTHMCFASRREKEFSLRIAGTPYLEILKQGGGILSSVAAVSDTSEDNLFKTTLALVESALQLGTTTLEIKSGYGLDMVNELKMLRVIGRVSEQVPVDVIATFLGAHAIPPEYKEEPDRFIDMMISDVLPEVSKQGIATFCDIFCEKGVFTIKQARRLLNAAKGMGFGVKIHADEVHNLGGAGLAAEIGAISADHLLAAGKDHLMAMQKAGSVAILLPATAYSLRKGYADARMMIDLNLPVALATDCNPGSSFTESMQFVYGLAVLNMMMSPSEALIAATLNSAYGIGMAARTGSLDRGKQADFLLVDGESPAVFAYHAGTSSVEGVYKKGNRIF